MKHAKMLLFLGIWFFIIPLLGIPSGLKKFLLVIPALFLIAMAITRIRAEKAVRNQFTANQEELIHEIANDLAEDIVEEANMTTRHEMKKLRDTL
ncbi:MAG TPA: hypothetical protein PKZ56_02120 [Candidatus Paceibacterota bacterium]|nr:hypothetical protein [Candidatus Paceibacterota bacterium]